MIDFPTNPCPRCGREPCHCKFKVTWGDVFISWGILLYVVGCALGWGFFR